MFKATRGPGGLGPGGAAGGKEVYFTDDGFAMGVAYCLAILKQTRKFEALHWTDTVRAKVAADARQVPRLLHVSLSELLAQTLRYRPSY